MKVPHSRVMLLNFFLLTLFVGVAHADYRDDEWNHNAVFTTQKQAGTKVPVVVAAVVLGLKLMFGSGNEEASHEVSSGQGQAPVDQQYCTLYEPNPAEVERTRLKNLAHKKKQKLERAKREAQERILAIEQEKEAEEHRKRALAEAFENIIFQKYLENNKWLLRGQTVENLEIEMFVILKKSGWIVETFYPKI